MLLENLKSKHATVVRADSVDFAQKPTPPTQSTCKVQKQISLYEKDSNSLEYKKLADEVSAFTKSPSKMKVKKRWIIGPDDSSQSSGALATTVVLSVDNLPAAAANVENQPKTLETTKSCINLKSCISNPGAVLVKAKFIEPPLRVAKSFHGNTSYLNKCKSRQQNKVRDLGNSSSANCLSTDSVFSTNAGGGAVTVKHRFTATKVEESGIIVNAGDSAKEV